MRVVFAFDHRFVVKDGAVYSSGQFPARIWDRYLKVFDAITVVSRSAGIESVGKNDKLDLSSRPEVSFEFLPSLSSIRGQILGRREARDRVRRIVAGADAVIARLPSQIGGLAIDAARELGRPWAAELVTCPWDALWNYGSLRGKLYAPILTGRTRSQMRDAPFALYVTEHFLQSRYPNRGGVTVNVSNVEIPAPEESALAARLTRIDVPPGRPIVFGLIGTLKTRFKGIQTVLAALGKVRDQLPPFEFRVLGGGDQAPWKALAESSGVGPQVRFDGVLPAGQPVLNWLDDVDVYLQPSFQEGLPRSLVEAMSRACPAIGSTCAGIPELLEADCMIEPGDVDALAALLVRAASDSNWRRSNASRNWAHARKYASDILSARRDAFWQQFGDHVHKAAA